VKLAIKRGTVEHWFNQLARAEISDASLQAGRS